ncbi:hypothetical protein [Kitasatospora aureofaciens]|uniref:hypothetical protein n=1 Tax=Kitasatospora aureofaciens TaxID=1894 RepID=UPI00380CB5AF
MSTSDEQPQRSGRHAAPRTPVRVRLRGRALAMAAVPTALLMAAAYTPNPALADSTAGKPCGTAPAAVPDVASVVETPVPKSELPVPPPGPSATPTTGPTTAPTSVPTQAPTIAPAPQPSAPTKTPTAAPTATVTTQPPAVRSSVTGTGAGSAVYQGNASGTPNGTAKASQAGLIDDILGGINNLLNPGSSPSATPSATSSATPAPAPAAPAPRAGTPAQPAQPQAPAAGQPQAQPSARPSAQPNSGDAVTQAPKPSATGKATPKPTPSASASTSGTATPSASASPTASPTANPNCAVDTRNLTAAAAGEHVVPEQNWTLLTSRLGLHGSEFHGVYDVKTPTGTKRVLKFVVASVDIENLDMSTLEGNGVTFHVQGAPGSTSTMRNGPVTMYVERLSGHLSKVLGLPIPIDLGEITLTPDTLPRWLYDLIGSVPIPLDLELTGVTAKQAGQFGGTLTIPGMHLFNDNAPYSNK